MKIDRITPSVLKVTSNTDLDVSKDLQDLSSKSIANLIENAYEKEEEEIPQPSGG